MSNLSPIKAMKRIAACSIKCSSIPSLAASPATATTVVGILRNIQQVPTMEVATQPVVKRQVSFGKIQIREYAPTIGDQPFVSTGVPIALGNVKVREIKDVPIDTYEHVRQPLRRQNSKQLILKPKVRAAMLLSEGFKKEEILDAALAALEAKTLIQHSVQMKSWDRVNEELEKTTRLWTNMSSRRSLLQRQSSFSE